MIRRDLGASPMQFCTTARETWPHGIPNTHNIEPNTTSPISPKMLRDATIEQSLSTLRAMEKAAQDSSMNGAASGLLRHEHGPSDARSWNNMSAKAASAILGPARQLSYSTQIRCLGSHYRTFGRTYHRSILKLANVSAIRPRSRRPSSNASSRRPQTRGTWCSTRSAGAARRWRPLRS